MPRRAATAATAATNAVVVVAAAAASAATHSATCPIEIATSRRAWTLDPGPWTLDPAWRAPVEPKRLDSRDGAPAGGLVGVHMQWCTCGGW